MADIRIKDLTTTASTTAADDFFAADGATNGTRKLSAYSPSFGGNATVGGTLTVNGASSLTAGGLVSYGSLTLGASYASLGGGFQTSYDSSVTRIFYGDGTGYSLRFATRASSTTTDRVTLSDAGVLTLAATTASTSTSSGALVVGNGSSGGLGVGGAINAGGEITVAGNLTITGNNSALTTYGYNAGKGLSLGLFARGQSGGWTTGLHFYSSNTDNSASWYFNPTNGDLTLYSSSSSSNYASTDRALLINTSKQVQVLATTASTSTSSGALVVSGGVGVAGAIYAGGAINSTQTISGNDLVATAGYAEIKGYGGTAGTGILFLGQSSNNNFISGTSSNMTFRLSNTTRLTVDATDITVASGTALKLGNAYVAGAPAATGYIVIKDSTGTSYKIPAQAL